eukprot:7886043-Alexandrium_andersonii.AAC.1
MSEPECDRQFEDLRRWQATIGTGIRRWDCRSRLCAFLFGRQWCKADRGVAWLELLLMFVAAEGRAFGTGPFVEVIVRA